MKELTFSDYLNLVLIGMAMLFFFGRVGEWFFGLLYDFGWSKWKYTMFKNKRQLAVLNMCRAYDLSKATVNEVHVEKLSQGYVMLIISQEKADEIWARSDGQSSTTAPSSDSSSTQEQPGEEAKESS